MSTHARSAAIAPATSGLDGRACGAAEELKGRPKQKEVPEKLEPMMTAEPPRKEEIRSIMLDPR
jgi:hypothetical protein